MGVQALAQLLLVACGNSLEDSSLAVCFLTILAPLYFPKVNVMYKQAFAGLAR